MMVNLQAVVGMAAASAIAIASFRKWRPSVVVSLGGYASLPCVLAAALWKVPVVVLNVDAVPGAANCLAARLAVACAVPASRTRLPKAVVTGVPVRAELVSLDRGPVEREAARKRLGLPSGARVIAVCGGSLGARRINRAALELAGLWAERQDLAIHHVVGNRDWEEIRAAAPTTRGLVYQQVRYEEDMATLYTAADLAVQRAGASSVAELAIAGLPSVLVPLPGAPGGHQEANARAMAIAGGAIVVPDAELGGSRLAREIEQLLANPDLIVHMGEAAAKLARPQAAQDVARLAEEHARADPKGGVRADSTARG